MQAHKSNQLLQETTQRNMLNVSSVRPPAIESTHLIKPMKFHWRLCQGGHAYQRTRANMKLDSASALPQIEAQLEFAKAAENAGIDSLLVDFGYNKPDSVVLATALGVMTEKINLIIACRSGIASPTAFVQQINTLSSLIPGRVSLNVVDGDLMSVPHLATN